MLRSDVLIAPHHGSKTSSSNEFIQIVSPDAVVFSTGFYNRWHMPAQQVVKRYQKHEVKTFNTAIDGTIKLDVSDEGIEIKTFRHDIWPYWFAN